MARHVCLGALAAALTSVAEAKSVESQANSAAVNAGSTSESYKRVIGYYTNWAQYRPGEGQFFPEDLDGTKFTHMNYAFARVTLDYEVEPFEWNDVDQWNPDEGMYKRFHAHLRAQNPRITTSISLGGWNFGSTIFSPMVRSESSRATFIKSAIAFARDHTFDGIDMDWEYPSAQDKENYGLLISEMRTAIQAEAASTGKPPLLLSMAVPAGVDKINAGFDVPVLSEAVDWLGVMSYDLHGSWESVTGAHTALFNADPNDPLTGAYALKYWEKQGAPVNKLVMGLATYGRGWTLASEKIHTVGSATKGASAAGEFTREAGFLAWYEIRALLNSSSYATERFEYESETMYGTVGDQWIGYDSPTTIKIKTRYVQSREYAGVMIWSCDLDDFKNGYPLISSVAEELLTSLNFIGIKRTLNGYEVFIEREATE